MEKENIYGEQPETSCEQTPVREEQMTIEQYLTNVGSPINKFKNVDNLAKAYASLEKEFTKKCQLIKELEEKSVRDNAVAPQYTEKDWQERVSVFFESNPKAKRFVEEISSVLSSDKDIACSSNSLELAYSKVLANTYKTNEELMEDENFISEYVLKNKKVKEKIINEYLNEITNKRAVPLMSDGGGNSSVLSKNKPSNITEAGKLAKALFKI